MFLGLSTFLVTLTIASCGIISHTIVTEHSQGQHILSNVNDVPTFQVLAFAGPVRRYTAKILSASGYSASAPGSKVGGRYIPDNLDKLYDDGSYKPDHSEKFYDDGSYKGEKIYWYKGKRIYW